MEEPTSEQLSKVARQASECAQEAVKITHDIMLAIKVADPTLRKIHKDLSCFADHCSLLSLQLRDPSGLQGLVAKSASEKYWKYVYDLLDMWHKNMVDTVQRLRKNRDLRTAPTNWILSSNTLTRWDPRMWSVEAAAESYTQDAQLVTALLNLQLTLRTPVAGKSGHHLDFLVKDLERKARTVHDRVSRLRQELKLPPAWSGTQSFIAELAMETTTDITMRTKGLGQGSTIRDEPLIDEHT